MKGSWIYKGNFYEVVAIAQSKNQQTRCWQTSIIYKDKIGALFVREEKEFKERFRRLKMTGISSGTIFIDDPEINPPAPTGKLKEWYESVIKDVPSEQKFRQEYQQEWSAPKDGESCGHRGCLNHISHPCEGCGRISGKRK